MLRFRNPRGPFLALALAGLVCVLGVHGCGMISGLDDLSETSEAGLSPTDCAAAFGVMCNGQCVNPATDPNNCGRCGNQCPANLVCKDGRCGCGTDCTGCVPDCTNRICGNDLCNGICGPGCPSDNFRCTVDGQCACKGPLCGGTCCAEGDVCLGDQCCTPSCTGLACGQNNCNSASCGTCTAANTECSDAGQCACSYASCNGSCCNSGQVCYNNACCTPSCSGKACGPNSCNSGTCPNTCNKCQHCNGNSCAWNGGNPCAGVTCGGPYCGRSTQCGFNSGVADQNSIYYCNGTGGQYQAPTCCTNGCIIEPPGTPDKCG